MAKKQQSSFDSREMAVISEAVRQSGEAAEAKMKNFNWLMGAIILTLFIGFITMFAAIGTMILDSLHFNSATYKEYSLKTDTYNKLLEENKKNQEIVIENQKVINQILKETKQ